MNLTSEMISKYNNACLAQAEWCERQEAKECYDQLKLKADAFLQDFEDLQGVLGEVDNVGELAGLLTDAGLDTGLIGNRVQDLETEMKQIKRSVSNIIEILEDLKGV